MTNKSVFRIFSFMLLIGWLSACQKPTDNDALKPEENLETTDLMVALPTDEATSNDLSVRNRQESYCTYYGPRVKVGYGYLRSWMNVSRHGKPLAIGAEMTASSLEGLPQDPEDFAVSTYILPLHHYVKGLTPFDHLTINWNVHGHEPPGVYDIPHFDFHFHELSIAEQTSIPPYEVSPAGFDNLPSIDFLPDFYLRAPGGVPGMGTHWVDLRSPELNGMPFTHTFIYGTYKGRVHFIEPMITHALIKSGQTVLKEIRQPKKFYEHSYYPTRYAIWKDCRHNRHYVALDNFVWH